MSFSHHHQQQQHLQIWIEKVAKEIPTIWKETKQNKNGKGFKIHFAFGCAIFNVSIVFNVEHCCAHIHTHIFVVFQLLLNTKIIYKSCILLMRWHDCLLVCILCIQYIHIHIHTAYIHMMIWINILFLSKKKTEEEKK